MNENTTGRYDRTFLFVLGKPYGGRTHFEGLLRRSGIDFCSIDFAHIIDFKMVDWIVKNNSNKKLFVVTYFPKNLEDVRILSTSPTFRGEWLGLWIDRTDEFCLEKSIKGDRHLDNKKFQEEVSQFDNFMENGMEQFCLLCKHENQAGFHATPIDCELNHEVNKIIHKFNLDRFKYHLLKIPSSTDDELVGFVREG
jgi:hypothetical protein